MKQSLLISTLIIIQIVYSQSTTSMIDQVCLARKTQYQHIFSNERDSIFSLFDSCFKSYIHDSSTFHVLPDSTNSCFLVNSLDTVSKGRALAYAFMNKIGVTSCKRMTVYSYDHLNGGSNHSYSTYIQYSSSKGETMVIPFDTAEYDADVGVYKIIEYTENDTAYYLLFGYGTHGGGFHHYSIHVFSEINGILQEVLPGRNAVAGIYIKCSRTSNPKITFNNSTGRLTYSYFEPGDGLPDLTPNLKTMRLIRGVFQDL